MSSVHLTAILLLCSALVCGNAVVAAPKSSSPKPKAAASVPADAAALVNGEPLPERIVDAFVRNGQDALGINVANEEGRKRLAQLREAIIDEQIGRLLIAQEARRKKIWPGEAEIDAAESLKITGMNTEERYLQFLEKNHFSRADYRQYVIASDLSGKALADSFAKGISVGEDEVKKFHETHGNDPEFQWPERVTVAHILLDTRPGVLAEQLKIERNLTPGPELDGAVAAEIERKAKRAEEIRQEALQPGADFGGLAAKYSEDFGTRNKGGSLGTAGRGMRPVAFDDVAFSLKPGEIGPVVKTEFGFHVLKVLDRRPAEPQPFDVQAVQIRQRLSRERQVKRMREWLENARRRAKIVIKG